jgi:hypothetical protein
MNIRKGIEVTFSTTLVWTNVDLLEDTLWFISLVAGITASSAMIGRIEDSSENSDTF